MLAPHLRDFKAGDRVLVKTLEAPGKYRWESGTMLEHYHVQLDRGVRFGVPAVDCVKHTDT